MWPNLPRSCYFLKILITFTKTHCKLRLDFYYNQSLDEWIPDKTDNGIFKVHLYKLSYLFSLTFRWLIFFWIQHLCLYLYPSTFTKFHLKCLFKCVKISSSQSSFAYETFHLSFHIYYTMFWTSFKNAFGCV